MLLRSVHHASTCGTWNFIVTCKKCNVTTYIHTYVCMHVCIHTNAMYIYAYYIHCNFVNLFLTNYIDVE